MQKSISLGAYFVFECSFKSAPMDPQKKEQKDSSPTTKIGIIRSEKR